MAEPNLAIRVVDLPDISMLANQCWQTAMNGCSHEWRLYMNNELMYVIALNELYSNPPAVECMRPSMDMTWS